MVAVLEVEGLRAGYATGDVLQGVNITVAPGEVVGVLGRNGVGKSTLMKAVIGLLPARSGMLRVKRIEGITLVRETGWVYIRGARVPRVVQQMFEALRRTMPRLKLAPPR